MGETEDYFKKTIGVIMGKNPALCSTGTATDVDETKRTCTIVLNEHVSLYNCRLNAVIDNYSDRILCIPKDGSKVAYILAENQPTNAIVIAYSEIEKIDIKIDGQTFKANKDGFVFNDGKNDGMVKVIELTNKINTIENDINTLKQIFSTWLVAPTDGGGALKTAAAAWYGNMLQSTDKSEIENEKIKH